MPEKYAKQLMRAIAKASLNQATLEERTLIEAFLKATEQEAQNAPVNPAGPLGGW